jgi:hypothetical protein
MNWRSIAYTTALVAAALSVLALVNWLTGRPI